jgi:biopolymer transport protein ExbD
MPLRRRSRRERRREAGDVDVTAFMNLMVVLTPFLLITAVFSRVTILELDLPTGQSEPAAAEEPKFALEIVVRAESIEVGDRNAGVLNRLQRAGDDYPLAELGDFLARVKQQFPDETAATLLLEPDVAYQTVVAVMDKVRVAEIVDPATRRVAKLELFPEISIGDAPVPN